MNVVFEFALYFLSYVVAHIVLLHLLGSDRFILKSGILLAVFLGLPVLPINQKLVFLSLWNIYIFALICARNSVSLRVLDELLRTAGESLEKKELLSRFSDRESLNARLELMGKNGFLRRMDHGEIVLAPKARAVARVILFARSIFGVRNPG